MKARDVQGVSAKKIWEDVAQGRPDVRCDSVSVKRCHLVTLETFCSDTSRLIILSSDGATALRKNCKFGAFSIKSEHLLHWATKATPTPAFLQSLKIRSNQTSAGIE